MLRERVEGWGLRCLLGPCWLLPRLLNRLNGSSDLKLWLPGPRVSRLLLLLLLLLLTLNRKWEVNKVAWGSTEPSEPKD